MDLFNYIFYIAVSFTVGIIIGKPIYRYWFSIGQEEQDRREIIRLLRKLNGEAEQTEADIEAEKKRNAPKWYEPDDKKAEG